MMCEFFWAKMWVDSAQLKLNTQQNIMSAHNFAPAVNAF